jgi:hypothetical protein
LRGERAALLNRTETVTCRSFLLFQTDDAETALAELTLLRFNEGLLLLSEKPRKAVMLNEPFRAEAREGEVKHPPNGFCSVVFAEARVGGWFAAQAPLAKLRSL